MPDLVAELEKRTDDLTTFLLMQTWRLTNQMRPLIDQILTAIHQGQEHVSDSGLQKDIDAQIAVPNQVDRVQAVFDRVLQHEAPSNLTSQPDVSAEQELESQLRQAGIGATLTEALVEEIYKQRKQLTHAAQIDPLSHTGDKSRLEIPKGWIMVVDSYNEGKHGSPDVFCKASLTLAKYDLSLLKLILNSSVSGPPTTAVNGCSIE